MGGLQPVRLQCPHCGEAIEVLVEGELGPQEYPEDCPVCCRPMVLSVRVGEDGEVFAEARREND